MNIIMAQFGPRSSLIEPSFSSFKKFFSDSNFILYTDSNIKIKDVDIKVVKSPFDKNHYRYGNRNNDYFKVLGLLESTSELSMCVDNDMVIVSDKVNAIISLTKRFGMCIPCNPRYLVSKDTIIGEDSDKVLDESLGTGFALNMSPISFFNTNEKCKSILENYCLEMTKNPVRGPLAMWRAIWKSGTMPCMLPPQWCVCLEHCGIGEEIILHVGHDKVKGFYNK